MPKLLKGLTYIKVLALISEILSWPFFFSHLPYLFLSFCSSNPVRNTCRQLWNTTRNHQNDFQSGCTILQSHQQWRSVPFPPQHLQHLLSPEFFILGILTGVRWNLSVVLIWIFLITKGAEHFFRCFKAIQEFPQLRIPCLAL